MNLFVKHLWWHRVASTAPDGNALTECGLSLVPSTLTTAIESVEQGSGCVDCIPEKANPSEIARKAAEATVTVPAVANYDGLTKAELVALAAERGLEVDPTATNAVLRDAHTAEDSAAEIATASAPEAVAIAETGSIVPEPGATA